MLDHASFASLQVRYRQVIMYPTVLKLISYPPHYRGLFLKNVHIHVYMHNQS